MDVLTPKQARFFSKLGERLSREGIGIGYTTRKYYESDRMLRILGIKATSLGRFGESLYEKVLFSARRVETYVKFLTKTKPDLVFTFGSPDASRAAFGLKIPHMMANDSPHAEAVARLTVPLSQKLFTPWIIPKGYWARYGISERDVVHYNGLDQVAWMKGTRAIEPNERLRERPIIVYRPEEYKAAYVSSEGPSGVRVVKQTLRTLQAEFDQEASVIVLGRYGHLSMYRKLLGPSVIIPRYPLDGIALLRKASALIGSGGTMTGEAALLGIPAISLSRSVNLVEKFLMKKGLIFRPTTPEAAANLILSFLEDGKKMRRQMGRACKILERMEDPTERICSFITQQAS